MSDLEHVLFNEDGTFNPITGSSGTVDYEFTELRDLFLESEREFVIELLNEEHFYNYFVELLEHDSDDIAIEADRIRENLESGRLETPEELKMMEEMSPEERDEYHMKVLSRAEAHMALLLAAVKDYVLVKRLVKTMDHGRSR